MTLRLGGLTIRTARPEVMESFWSGLVGTADTQVALRFVEDPHPPEQEERVHLHVTSDHAASQQAVVDQAIALGATHVDVGQQPDEDHVVLADPDGHPFCVIEPGNSYLAGTGVLGELACDGTREVGLFWSAVLDWPLVWDQDEETAIQSPAGGTKVAWGGPPVAPLAACTRQRLDLVSDDLETDLDLLVSLGATQLNADAFTDPDGNEFRVSAH